MCASTPTCLVNWGGFYCRHCFCLSLSFHLLVLFQLTKLLIVPVYLNIPVIKVIAYIYSCSTALFCLSSAQLLMHVSCSSMDTLVPSDRSFTASAIDFLTSLSTRYTFALLEQLLLCFSLPLSLSLTLSFSLSLNHRPLIWQI